MAVTRGARKSNAKTPSPKKAISKVATKTAPFQASARPLFAGHVGYISLKEERFQAKWKAIKEAEKRDAAERDAAKYDDGSSLFKAAYAIEHRGANTDANFDKDALLRSFDSDQNEARREIARKWISAYERNDVTMSLRYTIRDGIGGPDSAARNLDRTLQTLTTCRFTYGSLIPVLRLQNLEIESYAYELRDLAIQLRWLIFASLAGQEHIEVQNQCEEVRRELDAVVRLSEQWIEWLIKEDEDGKESPIRLYFG